MRSAASLAIVLIGCARGEIPAAADSPAANSGSSAAKGPSAAAPQACPATGLWSECAIVERLERSGLAPRRDSGGATEPPLTAPGLRVRLGRGELEIYLYPDVASREREQATLDRSSYLEYTSPVSMAAQPTLIPSANALVILHSRNDHQRERVGDAITAGPPNRPR